MIFFSRRRESGRALAWLAWLTWPRQRANGRWRAALAARYDTAPESIVVSDLNDIVVYANAAAQN